MTTTTELPLAGAETDWFNWMHPHGLADGYETYDIIFELSCPIPPLCRKGRMAGYPDTLTRSTRPDLCRIRGNHILFTELKSGFPANNPEGFLGQIWKLPIARRVITDFQIDFMLVFTSDRLIYSSLKRRQVRRILRRIGLLPDEWDIRSAEALEARIARSFPTRYPPDGPDRFDYDAEPRTIAA